MAVGEMLVISGIQCNGSLVNLVGYYFGCICADKMPLVANRAYVSFTNTFLTLLSYYCYNFPVKLL